MPDYTAAIKQRLAQGFLPSDIYKSLLAQGCNQSDLAKNFRTIYQNDQLFTYVQSMLTRGYPPQTLTDSLIKQGYSSDTVRFYIQLSSAEEKKPIKPVSLLLIGIALLIISLGLLYVTFQDTSNEFTFGLSMNPAIASSGQQVSVTYTFDSLPDIASLDITTTLYDPSKQKITGFAETVVINANQNVLKIYQLPDNLAPGRYTFASTARFDQSEQHATFEFSIGYPEQQESEVAQETIAPITQEPEVILQSKPKLAGAAVSRQSIQTIIDGLAGKQFPQGDVYCKQFTGVQSNNCYGLLAKQTGEKNACLKIGDSFQKDECLLWLALDKNDPSLCSLITTTSLGDNCKILKKK